MAERQPRDLARQSDPLSADTDEFDAVADAKTPWTSFLPEEHGIIERTAKRYARAFRRTKHVLSLQPNEFDQRHVRSTKNNQFSCPAGRTTFNLCTDQLASPYGWVRFRLKIRGDVRRVLSVTLESLGRRVPVGQQVTLFSLGAFHRNDVTCIVYVPPQAEHVQLSLMASDPFSFDLLSCSAQEVSRFERVHMVSPNIRRALGNPAFFRTAFKRAKPYIKRRDFHGLYQKMHQSIDAHFPMGLYVPWLERFGQIDLKEARQVGEALAAHDDAPLISVVMPTYNTDPEWLEAAIESVEQQAYPKWQLCIADDASTRESTRAVLKEAAARDPRIEVIYRTTNGHISAATNTAIEAATGSFVGFLDHDDALMPHALLLMADAIRKHPDARLFYSDEDKLNEDQEREDPYFKPDFGPDLLRSQNYICHFTCLHKGTLEQVGGLRRGFEGAQDWDLVLRATERLDRQQIIHIPHVLYHWRRCEGSVASSVNGSAAKPYAYVNAEKALAEHLQRTGVNAEVRPAHTAGFYRTHFAVPDPKPHVTLIVPTRDNPKDLRACIDTIRSHTSYPHYDILVIDNDSHTRAAKDELNRSAMQPNVRVLRYPYPFNYSAINNFAVAHAQGDIVCLVNDDIEATHSHWLEEMLGHVCRPEVGAVGPRLLYPDGRIQHAGVLLGIGGMAGHAFRGFSSNFTGFFGRLHLCQNFSAVTGACLMVKKADYLRVGGLDEDFKVAFNDVDFSLKLQRLGLFNVYTPYATLLHKEGSSRGSDTMVNRKGFATEAQRMVNTWGPLLCSDPFYNQNLSRTHEDMSLAFPPRQTPMDAIRAVRCDSERPAAPGAQKRNKSSNKKRSAQVSPSDTAI